MTTNELQNQIETELQQEYFNNFLSKLPPRYRDVSFETFKAVTLEQQETLRICKSFAEAIVSRQKTEQAPTMNLIFFGLPGTGKTHLAISILKHVMEQTSRYRTCYAKCFDMSVLLDRAFSSVDQTSAFSKMKRFSECHLLVIDDGIRLTLPSACELFFHIIDQRYQNSLSTILITNETDLTKLDDRVISRLSDRGACIQFLGDDYRKLYL